MLGDESRWEELFDKYPGKRPATSEEVADLDRLPGFAERPATSPARW